MTIHRVDEECPVSPGTATHGGVWLRNAPGLGGGSADGFLPRFVGVMTTTGSTKE